MKVEEIDKENRVKSMKVRYERYEMIVVVL